MIIVFTSKKLDDSSFIDLILYVDNILMAYNSKSHIFELRNMLSNEFEMEDLKAAKKIFGIDINRDRKVGNIWLI